VEKVLPNPPADARRKLGGGKGGSPTPFEEIHRRGNRPCNVSRNTISRGKGGKKTSAIPARLMKKGKKKKEGDASIRKLLISVEARKGKKRGRRLPLFQCAGQKKGKKKTVSARGPQIPSHSKEGEKEGKEGRLFVLKIEAVKKGKKKK